MVEGRGRGVFGPEVRLEVRRRMVAGDRVELVALAAGMSVRTVWRIVKEAGGMPPRSTSESRVRMNAEDREQIMRGIALGETCTAIGARLKRHPSTISREIARNHGRAAYLSLAAQRATHGRWKRAKTEKLAELPRLRAAVEFMLEQRWSPQEISGRLRLEFPDDEEMRVSHETIYQSLFVVGRGALRKELVGCLRSGRTRRKPHGRTVTGKGQIRDMVMIADRPAEVEDRAVPGHWEGDLILGSVASRSSIGTLVERTSRLVMLFPLGTDRTALHTRLKLAEIIQTLPVQLCRSLTWDQGKEMAQHAQFTIDTGVQVYFCDPHCPWQRGSNENTNGLLREYFPKGTDLSQVTQATCDAVAAQLNNRPRKALGWHTPLESFAQLRAETD